MSDVAMSLDELRAVARSKLREVGLSDAHVTAVAETMVAGERDGCASHGIYRLLVAARSVAAGVVVPDAVPVVHQPAAGLVKVDGRGGFAQLPFDMGLPLLVESARTNGIAALAVTNAVHFAALWPEVEAVVAHGLVALAMTPSHAWVAPAGGTRPLFGTNPIAFGWPRPDGAPFVFDFATSAVARGEIELKRRAGAPVPEDWGYDAQGRPTTDPAAVLDGAMRTFGGHKGSALAAMVELMAGPLIGDMTSAESLRLDDGRGGSPIGGELVIAIDPALLMGPDPAGRLAAAEALFDGIVGQGARLPSARRHAARARSLAEGVRIPIGLFMDIMSIGEAQ
jgi:LDH2 family malate/lactate/ureidoglycolate dehydrogenase